MSNKIIKAFKQSYKLINNNFKVFLLSLGFDMMFFYVIYGFIVSTYNSKIFEYLNTIGSIAMSGEGVKTATNPTFTSIFFNPQTSGYFINIIILLTVLFASVYFLFSFMIGVSTYTSLNIDKYSKKDLILFIKKFFKITIPWMIIIALREILSFYFFYIDTARQTVGLERTYFSYLNIIFTILLVYFIMISFMLPLKNNFKNSIKIGIKNYKLFIVYFILLIMFLILAFIAQAILFISTLLAMVYIALIVWGFLTFARLSLKLYYDSISIKN
jgi:hypothetical protein